MRNVGSVRLRQLTRPKSAALSRPFSQPRPNLTLAMQPSPSPPAALPQLRQPSPVTAAASLSRSSTGSLQPPPHHASNSSRSSISHERVFTHHSVNSIRHSRGDEEWQERGISDGGSSSGGGSSADEFNQRDTDDAGDAGAAEDKLPESEVNLSAVHQTQEGMMQPLTNEEQKEAAEEEKEDELAREDALLALLMTPSRQAWREQRKADRQRALASFQQLPDDVKAMRTYERSEAGCKEAAMMVVKRAREEMSVDQREIQKDLVERFDLSRVSTADENHPEHEQVKAQHQLRLQNVNQQIAAHQAAHAAWEAEQQKKQEEMDRALAEAPAKQKKLAEARKEVEALRQQNADAIKQEHDLREVLRLWKLHTSEGQQNDLSGEEPNVHELLAQNDTFKKHQQEKTAKMARYMASHTTTAELKDALEAAQRKQVQLRRQIEIDTQRRDQTKRAWELAQQPPQQQAPTLRQPQQPQVHQALQTPQALQQPQQSTSNYALASTLTPEPSSSRGGGSSVNSAPGPVVERPPPALIPRAQRTGAPSSRLQMQLISQRYSHQGTQQMSHTAGPPIQQQQQQHQQPMHHTMQSQYQQPQHQQPLRPSPFRNALQQQPQQQPAAPFFNHPQQPQQPMPWQPPPQQAMSAQQMYAPPITMHGIALGGQEQPSGWPLQQVGQPSGWPLQQVGQPPARPMPQQYGRR